MHLVSLQKVAEAVPYATEKPEEVSLPVFPAEKFDEERPPFDLMDISDSEAEEVLFTRKPLKLRVFIHSFIHFSESQLA